MKNKSKRSSTGHGTGALQAVPLHRSKLLVSRGSRNMRPRLFPKGETPGRKAPRRRERFQGRAHKGLVARLLRFARRGVITRREWAKQQLVALGWKP